jgi:hypothetical protein
MPAPLFFAQACGSTPPSPALLTALSKLPEDPLILFLGDLHGSWPAATAAYRAAVREKGRRPDLLIQVGDWGYYPQRHDVDPLWTLTPEVRGAEPDAWEHPVVFIDGNHEAHAELWRESPSRLGWPDNVFFAPRGMLWAGILFMGGAASVNKAQLLRTGKHWSPLEEVTTYQTIRVLELVKVARNSGQPWEDPHTVISHTGPSSFNLEQFASSHWGGENKQEPSRLELERLRRALNPQQWVFGHWHASGRGYCGRTLWRLLDQIPSGPYPDYDWATLSQLRSGTAFRG